MVDPYCTAFCAPDLVPSTIWHDIIVNAITVVGALTAAVIGAFVGARMTTETTTRIARQASQDIIKESIFGLFWTLMAIYSRQRTMIAIFRAAHVDHARHTATLAASCATLQAQHVTVLDYFCQFLRPFGNLPPLIHFDLRHVEHAYRIGGDGVVNSLGALDDRYNAAVTALQTYTQLWLEAMKDLRGEIDGETASATIPAETEQVLRLMMARLDLLAKETEVMLNENLSATVNGLELLLSKRASYFKEPFNIILTDPNGNEVPLRFSSDGSRISVEGGQGNGAPSPP